ncbi:hypothetical protein CAPTEDRAFT_136710, partial [Capitella teleta]
SSMEVQHFHWADYLAFVLSLMMSASIGIYYGWTDRKKKSTEDYLMAGRSMSILPVAVSLFVSWASAISFLGDPVQVYYYGTIYWLFGVGYCLAIPPAAHFFAPKLHRMKLISANEFLGVRFNNVIRIGASISISLQLIPYLGLALYAPSLALSQVTDMEVWIAVLVVGSVGTFYTSLGGMKAVLWADTLQFFLMIAGILAVLIQGIIVKGGIVNVWRIAEKGGRISFNNFDPNPFQAGTVWTYLIGGFFRVFNSYVSVQAFIQRYCTLPTERAAKIALYATMPMFFFSVTIFSLLGLVLYAFYHDCDPLTSGQISKSDQMLPLLTLRVLSFLPGMPGLFLACIFGACLSSLSSLQPALAALWLRDFIMPIFKANTKQEISNSTADKLAKGLSLMFGIITIILAFLMDEFKDSNLFSLTNTFTGMFGAPVAGVFVVGLTCNFVKSRSMLGGAIVGLAIPMWWGVGSFFYPNTEGRLPVSTDGCEAYNATYLSDGITAAPYEIYSATQAPTAGSGYVSHGISFGAD